MERIWTNQEVHPDVAVLLYLILSIFANWLVSLDIFTNQRQKTNEEHNMKKIEKNVSNTPVEVWTKKETAMWLRVSSETVDRLRKKGLLTGKKVGGQVRFQASDVRQYWESL